MNDKSISNQIDTCLLDLKNGDNGALSVLYDLTAKPLYAVAYGYLKNRHDAEDVLSEAYLTAKRKIFLFKGKRGFNWLYTIVKNLSLNLLKKNSRQVSVDFTDRESTKGLDTGTEDVANDQSGILKAAQEVLSDAEYRIVILHAVDGLKFKEIAEMLRRIEATCRWQYNNAIKKLKKYYEGRSL